MADQNSNNNKKNKSDKSRELFERLEENLQQIEVDEILKGMLKEEIEEKGFVGDKKV